MELNVNQRHRPFVVTVDGPAGSGKSSVCQEIGSIKGWLHINTGLIYRAVAYCLMKEGVPVTQESLVSAANRVAKECKWIAVPSELWLDGRNIISELGCPKIGQLASRAAGIAEVRHTLLSIQRQLIASAPTGAIVDGRDIATVIYPQAQLKLFLTASIEERAKRRLEQLGGVLDEKNTIDSLEEVKRGIVHRDRQDEKRSIAPMKQANDAVLIDTSSLSEKDVIDLVLKMIQERFDV